MKDLLLNGELQYLNATEFTPKVLLLFMCFSFAFAIYIFIIYRITTRASFFSQDFGKTLLGTTIITTAIVLAMQGSLVISLGMVGALSIVRYRTAIKAPLDLTFLFWAISVGIICGSGLFILAGIGSIMMTVIVLCSDIVPLKNSSYILNVSGDASIDEDELLKNIKICGKAIHIRSRIANEDRVELLMELHTKQQKKLVENAKMTKGVKNVHLIYHDGEVRF